MYSMNNIFISSMNFNLPIFRGPWVHIDLNSTVPIDRLGATECSHTEDDPPYKTKQKKEYMMMNMKSLTMIVQCFILLSSSGCTMADGPRRRLVRQRRLLLIQPPASGVQPEQQHGGLFKLGSLRKLYDESTTLP